MRFTFNQFSRPMSRTLFPTIALLLGLAGLCLSALAKEPVAPARPALTVTLTTPQWAEWDRQILTQGNIVAWQESVIGAESQGLRLAEVHAEVGDVVKRGQLLARFASETLHTDIAQQQAAVAEAEATAFEAHENAERVRKLDDPSALSAQQITQAYTQEKLAHARLQAARARLAADQLRLQQTQVLAPDHGVISARLATLGAVVANGQELFRLVRQGRLEWRAELTANEAPWIHPGQKASLRLPGGAPVAGTVRRVAPTVDAQTRKLLVYVDLKAPDARLTALKPGMFAEGELLLGRGRVLTIPGTALVLRDGFSHVFVLAAQNKVVQTRVKPGRQRDGRVEVEGLTAEAQVVATGAGFLADGDVVRIAGR